MGKRILVIGGTGLLDEPVARHLRKSGFSVRLMVRNVAQAARRFGDGFEVVEGDPTDAWLLEAAVRNCFGVHINLSKKYGACRLPDRTPWEPLLSYQSPKEEK